MKIDTHIHLTPPHIISGWQALGAKEPYFRLLSESPVNQFADARRVLAMMDLEGIDRAVVFGFAFQDPGLCQAVNDYTIAQVQAAPDRLIGFAVVNPLDPKADTELVRCFEAGLRGVGELFPEGQGFSLQDHKVMGRLAEPCLAYGFPLLLHMNEPVGHPYPGKTSTPLADVEKLVDLFPELTLILAHWGGGLLFYELMPELRRKFSRVYYDTAASVFLYRHEVYEVAKTIGIFPKILFGSDFPLLPPSRYEKQIGRAGLSSEDLQGLWGGHAAQVLGLSS